jgi:hypothetical protein
MVTAIDPKSTVMKPIDNYCEFFASLTSDFKDETFYEFFAPHAVFEDPFQRVCTIEEIITVFRHMYTTLNNPRFIIKESMSHEKSGYIRWEFIYDTNRFEGVSHVVFNDEGLVVSHRDFWDAASNVYETIPLLGSLLRLIKHKIKAS